MQKTKQNLVKSSTVIIAIDGEPAAGKGTLAKSIANHFNMLYLDTGAMFRAVGLYFVKNGIDITDENIKKYIDKVDVTLILENNYVKVLLNKEDVTNEIRSNTSSMAAKTVSKNKLVRKRLLDLQRNIAKDSNCVVDGQDIGTTVFPNANVKIFLVCDVFERAKRRKVDFDKKGESITFDEVLKAIKERTHDDYNREESPLKKAEDAYLVDNTNLTKDETLNIAIDIINKRIGVNEKDS